MGGESNSSTAPRTTELRPSVVSICEDLGVSSRRQRQRLRLLTTLAARWWSLGGISPGTPLGQSFEIWSEFTPSRKWRAGRGQGVGGSLGIRRLVRADFRPPRAVKQSCESGGWANHSKGEGDPESWGRCRKPYVLDISVSTFQTERTFPVTSSLKSGRTCHNFCSGQYLL